MTADLSSPKLFVVSDDPSSVTNDIQAATPDAPSVVSIMGENVRRLRERSGLSLRELAVRAGVSTSTLSNLETGTGNPGVETLVNIGSALGVPFSELVLRHEPDVRVQRADEGVVVQAEGAEFSSRLLVAAGNRTMTEVYECAMEPSGVYHAEPHLPGVAESVIIVQGRMRVGPEEAPVELAPGDRATFVADRPHAYEALEPGTRVILVLSYR